MAQKEDTDNVTNVEIALKEPNGGANIEIINDNIKEEGSATEKCESAVIEDAENVKILITEKRHDDDADNHIDGTTTNQKESAATAKDVVLQIEVETEASSQEETDSPPAADDDHSDVEKLENGNSESTIAEDERNAISCATSKKCHNDKSDNDVQKCDRNSSSMDIVVDNNQENEVTAKSNKRPKVSYGAGWGKMQTFLLLFIIISFVVWIVLYFSYITGYPLPFVRHLLKSWFNV